MTLHGLSTHIKQFKDTLVILLQNKLENLLLI